MLPFWSISCLPPPTTEWGSYHWLVEIKYCRTELPSVVSSDFTHLDLHRPAGPHSSPGQQQACSKFNG